MLKMEYKSSFKVLVKKISTIKDDSELVESYLGTGNPNSEIIVFGKELGFDEIKIQKITINKT